MDALTVAGAALAGVSFVLMVVSRVQLGSAFSVKPEAKGLVTQGLYSRIRNPMYVFLDLTICGTALASHWWWMLSLLVLVPMQIRIARKEAAVLREAFGERYEEYRRGTWF